MSQDDAIASTFATAPEIEVEIKSDYPSKEIVITLLPTVSVLDLLQLASDKLGVKQGNYVFLAVNFMEDAFFLDLPTFHLPLIEAGIKNKTVVFFRAGVDFRPPARKLLRQTQGEDGCDKYHGINLSNVLLLANSKSKRKKHLRSRELAFEYLDIHCDAVVGTSKWKAISAELMSEILKRDTLSIQESKLFEALLAWGHAECKRQTEEKATLPLVLKDLLPFIRFPTMRTEDIALTVTPAGVLEPDQILYLYTYLGQQDPLAVLPPQLKFSNERRIGRRPQSWFRFSTNFKHPSLVLEDGVLLTSYSSSFYQSCFGEVVISNGISEWEIVATALHSIDFSLCIGVVPVSEVRTTLSYMIGYPGHMEGWAFSLKHGQKYNATQQPYGRKCDDGDVIRVRLDLSRQPGGTLEYFINGESQGVAFTNVKGPVRPAVTLCGNTSCVLRFP
eukprot:gb/GEZN01009007.1/.p1 GENE.gb/GEZN01009007.1/~~gb/GEZN01009007.1/.p1  ORF type:complete len:454 (-),score=11.94 gb/GEZN01009007.1/:6-1343(-)